MTENGGNPMMISPEGYYEEYLKGKDAAQIMTAIRGLKKEMGRLKNTMEHLTLLIPRRFMVPGDLNISLNS